MGLKESFGEIAEEYDANRPTYPPQLVETCRVRLAPTLPRTVFEIGCGTGQATELFLHDGFQVVASDLSDALLEQAKTRLAAYSQVSYLPGAFENLELPESAYSIVLSAQAFHWVDAAVGVPKAYQILKSGGLLVLVWNFIHYDADPLFQGVRERILALMPAFAGWPDASEERFAQFAHSWKEALELAPFQNYQAEVVSGNRPTTPEDFCRLIATYSWFRRESEETQQALLAEVARCFSSAGESLEIPQRTLIVSASKP